MVVGNHGCTPLLISQAVEGQTQRNKTHLRLPTFETTLLSRTDVLFSLDGGVMENGIGKVMKFTTAKMTQIKKKRKKENHPL